MLIRAIKKIVAKLKLTFYLRGSSRQLLSKIWQLKSGAVVYDLGANIGLFTQLFSDMGCVVFAFEPHPGAFKELSRKFSNKKNIHLFNVAIGDSDGVSPLFFHTEGDEEDIHFSQGTSLLASKPNVDQNKAIDCKVESIASILKSVDHVDFMKIDIEGAEIDVMNYLVSHPELLKKISYIGCETHEKKWPQLAMDTQEVRQKISNANLAEKFDFTWR